MNEQIDQRDQHIHRLETQLIELRKNASDNTLLKERLGKAATHLKSLTEENNRLQSIRQQTLQTPSNATNNDTTATTTAITTTTEDTKLLKEVARLKQHLIEAEESSTQESIKQHEMLNEFKAQIDTLTQQKGSIETLLKKEKELRINIQDKEDEILFNQEILSEENTSLKEQLGNFTDYY